MQTDSPQIDISRVLDAPRALVYRAFTDPEHFVAWWGPIGNSLPREEVDFDIRPSGHQRWTEVSATDPGIRVRVTVDLTAVADGELLDGVMQVSGRIPRGVEPFETRIRYEFSDATGGRTRLRIRQWLPHRLTGNATQGWREALTKLGTALVGAQKVAPTNPAARPQHPLTKG
ncbi:MULTISPECIES: SRPBCC family protein [Microbacterium]|uniref:SRPBCC domain-containing protein n=3 Tax=Microbacterium wangchenii TaxID=2541726 RepID=A0ABX5SV24_9MICO|nr:MULTISPECIES: SRPBCC domain-containing protein [Microbacterium]MCK6065233.1 SRPBCC domain-containing protein [Microbacterium sp. EYE_512]QBR88684.1 SRPBCC domain-containing protein [Microbacterium wangchenii]TFV82264.1 SRPBCC domain-containing protein [Microbacterium sp. dk485]